MVLVMLEAVVLVAEVVLVFLVFVVVLAVLDFAHQKMVVVVVHGHTDVVEHVACGDHVFTQREPAESCGRVYLLLYLSN